ncbi:phage tail protein [Paenibacillus xylanexedens]|uniref:phage tail protein n=1 Tax=Paenibacillus xylanexedens TaxID=528191 RepID=UPI001C92EFF0|nr:phage tail protein [Paenibacillus xylanexedens]
MPQETDRLKLPLPLGNENVTRESINGIFEKIDAGVATQEDLDTLREAVSKMDIPDASLTQKGKVQLSSKTDGTSEALVATEKALGLVMTEAAAAKQLGVETKNDVVATLNSIGVSASTSESWDSLILKMSGVIRATGNATVAQVLAGVTFSNATGNGRTGTMVNRGAVSQNITTQNGSYAIPAGYHNGSGVVRAILANLIASNIRNGVNIGGVVGSLIEGLPNARGTSSTNNYRLTVTGLSFTPQIILFYNTTFNPRRYGYFFNMEIFGLSGSYGGIVSADNNVPSWTDRRATFNANGFDISLNFSDVNVATQWIAIGGGNMNLGCKIYYDKSTGNVIVNTGERSGYVVETTWEQDFASYLVLSDRVQETVGMIQLEYGECAADYAEGGVITQINLDNKKPMFTYPDPVDPEAPQEPRPALSKQVDQLAAESNANQLALMELHMMLLGVVAPDEG